MPVFYKRIPGIFRNKTRAAEEGHPLRGAAVFHRRIREQGHGHMGDDHGGIVQYFEALADVTVSK